MNRLTRHGQVISSTWARDSHDLFDFEVLLGGLVVHPGFGDETKDPPMSREKTKPFFKMGYDPFDQNRSTLKSKLYIVVETFKFFLFFLFNLPLGLQWFTSLPVYIPRNPWPHRKGSSFAHEDLHSAAIHGQKPRGAAQSVWQMPALSTSVDWPLRNSSSCCDEFLSIHFMG